MLTVLTQIRSFEVVQMTLKMNESGSLSASLIGRQGQAPQAIRHSSVDVAHGLALLFGLGTKALPSWDSKTKWNNLSGGLAVTKTAGPSGQTISPHPSSREGHHSTGGWISISSYRI
jgi:hypothetical protein